MYIGTKLKNLLEESGQRQAQVARKMGWTEANLSRALTSLNLSSVLKIADGIGLELRIEDADGNNHPAADVEKFVKAAADTTMSWNDAETVLKALGFFLEFDWR